MANHLEVRHERLYVKVPGSDKLRKTADGRLRRLIADGWREVERRQDTEYVQVRLERSGHRPPMMLIPAAVPQQTRARRDNFGGGPGGGGRGPGGPGGRGPGGPKGPRDGAPAAAPASAPPAATPASAPPAATPASAPAPETGAPEALPVA